MNDNETATGMSAFERDDIELMGFDDLIVNAKRMLDTVYPATVFTGESIGAERIADIIAQHLPPNRPLEGIPAAAAAIVEEMHQNSGTRFIVMLRQLIAEIETRPVKGNAP